MRICLSVVAVKDFPKSQNTIRKEDILIQKHVDICSNWSDFNAIDKQSINECIPVAALQKVNEIEIHWKFPWTIFGLISSHRYHSASLASASIENLVGVQCAVDSGVQANASYAI